MIYKGAGVSIGSYKLSFDYLKLNTIGFHIYIGSNSDIIEFHCYKLKLAQYNYSGFGFKSGLYRALQINIFYSLGKKYIRY